MLKPVLENPWFQAAAVLVALLGVAFLAYLLSPVLVPLFAAFMVAYFLDPVVDYFENTEGKNRYFKWRLPRGITISVLALIGVLLVLSIPLVLVPRMILEAKELVTAATSAEVTNGAQGQEPGSQPAVGDAAAGGEEDAAEADGADSDASPWYERFLERIPLEDVVRQMGWEEPGRSARSIVAQKVGTFVRDNATKLLESTWSRFVGATTTFAQFARASGRALLDAVFFVAKFALFAFVAGYLLNDFDRLVVSARGLIPPRYRPKTVEIITKIDHQLRSFVRGQVTVCVFLGTMYGIGLTICDVPFALAIALFGTVVSLIPYLGVAMTVIPALLMAFLRHGFDVHLVGVVITFALAQGLEGNILTPRIVGNQVGLHPVWVILAIMVFGSALGFLGVLIAVPLAAALKVLVVEAVQYYKKSPVFEGGSTLPDKDGSGPDS
ncbi:MAG TPA: AI-2E family transporter [Candidatus Hydrogenedentes bacterium]|nr:AI-2E family transporter [Candidatus Hydrogenedentota bacterium]